MKLKYTLMAIATLSVLTGCTQIGEINHQLANWAGEQIKIRDKYKQEFTHSVVSKRDIDTLYTRIKREFNFQSLDESMKNCANKHNKHCKWVEMAITQNGFVHEKTPGVYYQMGHSYSNPDRPKEPLYFEVTLEKEGKSTLVSYKTRSDKTFADEMQQRLLKAIK